MLNDDKVKFCFKEAEKNLRENHIKAFGNLDKPLIMISDTYCGVWLEHVYDAILYAEIYDDGLEIAENTIEAFLKYQTDEGQLPAYLVDNGELNVGYCQIQECVSFTKLCYKVYEMNRNKAFLQKVYDGCKRWDNWLKTYRMTRNTGLIEMFVGYDTGHDNSSRLDGLSHEGNYSVNGVLQNASVMPEDDVAPIIAVDMNANFYAGKKYLSVMADELGLLSESEKYKREALEVKEKLFEICYDEKDNFLYDVDKNGNKRKYKSCTVFHLFMEEILNKDDEFTEKIYNQHIKNPDEFFTPYPFPSMAINDPFFKKKKNQNCWGYFSQGLIALRTTMWMENYGKKEDFKYVLEKWVDALTENFEKVKFGQEIDPITGEASQCSQWYSSALLLYIYAVKYLEGENKNEEI